ncbi:phosphate regulon sensor histidine kinase PhoR [Endozoicomonas euniceicola]|uniref:Phosphate regulon sensor protein PhoR n=1 Tax=Endozoicomonas euniceicola TaxID=1234143 RepID=A0ABY6H0J7_9GAMM|nr:phosphate regulon sensor histidine kinase PhoR [Endozoicomonas euniceicola]UYM18576.1 phosphate regulon sensor histidine kinase PhoR [Endozoicomonas euniceicola]
MTSITKSYVLSRMLLLSGVGFCLGWLLGNAFLGLSVVLMTYCLWSVKELFRLLDWLHAAKDRNEEPPESKGLWGEIFDGIYRLQKHHGRARRRLSTVIDRIQSSTTALKDAVIMVDRHNNLEWWNLAAEELLGFKTPDDKGQPITNLLRDPRFVDYFEQGRYQKPLLIPSPLNDEYQIEVNVTVYGRGNRMIIVRDVTRLMQLEIMRKDFVANVSHELRTPLTVISGYLETLIDGLHDHDLPPVWSKAMNRMQEQSLRMQGLVQDLLTLSKLEAAEIDENSAVSLRPMLHAIVEDGKALSGESQHKIYLECPEDAELGGCAHELRSAFSNLVFNAVRYTPAGGKIYVRWWQDEDRGHLMVEDNGIGIDPIHIPRLTERFYRVDKSRSHATGGTGLGLAIVKHIMLRHGGRISISSHPGKGSKFVCHFPKKRLMILADE